MSRHDSRPANRWIERALCGLSLVGRFRFLLLLVIPICVLGSAYLLYAQTGRSVHSIAQLYSTFPSGYETISPVQSELATKSSEIEIGESAGLTTVVVGVDRATEFRGRILWLTALLVFFLVAICAAIVQHLLHVGKPERPSVLALGSGVIAIDLLGTNRNS